MESESVRGGKSPSSNCRQSMELQMEVVFREIRRITLFVNGNDDDPRENPPPLGFQIRMITRIESNAITSLYR